MDDREAIKEAAVVAAKRLGYRPQPKAILSV